MTEKLYCIALLYCRKSELGYATPQPEPMTEKMVDGGVEVFFASFAVLKERGRFIEIIMGTHNNIYCNSLQYLLKCIHFSRGWFIRTTKA